MVQLEKLSFLLSLSVIVFVYAFVFTLNYSYGVGITEKGLNASSASESYTNSKIGVSLEHPADWKPVNLKNGFQLVKKKDVVYVEIRRDNIESSNTQLEQYVDDDINDRKSSRGDFKLLNKT